LLASLGSSNLAARSLPAAAAAALAILQSGPICNSARLAAGGENMQHARGTLGAAAPMPARATPSSCTEYHVEATAESETFVTTLGEGRKR
jgi:hypothetical protein